MQLFHVHIYRLNHSRVKGLGSTFKDFMEMVGDEEVFLRSQREKESMGGCFRHKGQQVFERAGDFQAVEGSGTREVKVTNRSVVGYETER